MPRPKFTVTQQKLLDVLSDGLPHTKGELKKCLPDPEYSEDINVTWHIIKLREQLKPIGQTIVCEFANRKRLYRHVRLLTPVSKG